MKSSKVNYTFHVTTRHVQKQVIVSLIHTNFFIIYYTVILKTKNKKGGEGVLAKITSSVNSQRSLIIHSSWHHTLSCTAMARRNATFMKKIFSSFSYKAQIFWKCKHWNEGKGLVTSCDCFVSLSSSDLHA